MVGNKFFLCALDRFGSEFWLIIFIVLVIGCGAILVLFRRSSDRTKLIAFGSLLLFMVLVSATAAFAAMRIGPGETRPSGNSCVTSSLAPLLASGHLWIAWAQEATPQLKDWTGWIYAGRIDSNTRVLVPNNTYIEIVGKSRPGAPSSLPIRGDLVRLLRPEEIFDRAPQFAISQLRYGLGTKLTTLPLSPGFVLEVTGECAVIASRDAWCPIVAKTGIVPRRGLLPDFPLRGRWTDLSQTYETRNGAKLETQSNTPNAAVVPRMDITLVFTRPLNKEPFRSEAILAMVGVGKGSRVPVLGSNIVVAVSTLKDVIRAFGKPEEERVAKQADGRRLPCFVYPSKGITFVADDKAAEVVVEVWAFETESYGKSAELLCSRQ